MSDAPTLKPYPDTVEFKWERGRYAYDDAVELMQHAAKQGGSEARRKAYILCADYIIARDHEDMESTEIDGAEMKRLLVEAARHVGWWDAAARRTFKKPPPAPSGHKVCFVCRETKATHEFLTDPTPAQIAKYGWKSDTTKKIPTHVCGECRHKRGDAEAKRRQRTAPRRDMTIKDPVQRERLHTFKKLVAQITVHKNRVLSKISEAKVELPSVDQLTGEETTYVEYQFSSEVRRDFYFLKRDLLDIAKARLETMLGTTEKLPHKWGMVLTKDEQFRLASLHDDAFGQMKVKPTLW